MTPAAMALEEWAFHRHERWRDLGIALVAAVLENVGYRQLTVWWRLEGGGRPRQEAVWGAATRTGFNECVRAGAPRPTGVREGRVSR